MTKLLTEKQIAEGVEIIRAGGIVALRTETVFGLGADAQNDAAVRKVYSAKQRPLTKPLAVQFPSVKELLKFFPDTDAQSLMLFQKFRSGISVVLSKEVLKTARGKISPAVMAKNDSLSVRIPSDKFTVKFLRACRTPLAMPSANTSARPAPSAWNAVYDDLNGRIDAVFMNKPCKFGTESTVVEYIGNNTLKVHRDGVITREQLAKKTKMLLK